MTPNGPLEAALAALHSLLDEQARAVLDGEADALAPLSALLASRLATLRATAGRAPSPSVQAELQALQSRAQANFDMINRRQIDVQRALDALGKADAGLQMSQATRTYSPAGAYAAPARLGKARAQA